MTDPILLIFNEQHKASTTQERLAYALKCLDLCKKQKYSHAADGWIKTIKALRAKLHRERKKIK